MRILIVGNGGREHALLWKLRRDLPDGAFFATQPNGGMLGLAEGVPIAAGDVEALTGWAAAQRIDLAVVGPEAPLAAGIADRFRKKGVPVFGPTADAARIEASKAFAKQLMVEAGVPTAEHRTFGDPDEAEAWVRERGGPSVVKASGLAAGKGAVVCDTVEEAVAAIAAMQRDRLFGEAGRELVVEERMEGEELSVFAITDGVDAILLPAAQDHKRIGEGDTGPNTGGMGAYAPVSIATPELLEEARARVVLPTLAALAARESTFKGVLYAGLMRTPEGLKVVEFNCRFGDPEAQVVLPMMEGSLLDLMSEVAEGGSLAGRSAPIREGAAVTTVLASEGYPGDYPKGRPIRFDPALADDPDILLFHAGTTLADGALRTSGGRVLAVTGLGSNLAEAAARSREGAERVSYEGKQYRRDIGWREFARDEIAKP